MMQILMLSYIIGIFVMSNAFEMPFLFKQVEFLAGGADPVVLHAKMLAYYNFAQVFFVAVSGYLSDKFGRKKILYIAGIILILAIIIQANANNIDTLLIARILLAVKAGGVVIVFATIGEIQKELRLKAMSYVSAAFALAYVIGPYIGGVLVGNIENLEVISNALWVSAVISATIFIAIFMLKESNIYNDKTEIHKFREIAGNVWMPIFVLAAASFLMSGIETFMPPSLYALSGSGKSIGTAFVALSITMAVTESILPWVFKFGKKNALIGFFIIAIGFINFMFANTEMLVFVSLIIISIGFGFVYPTIQALISLLTPKNKQGIAFSVAQLLRVLFAGIANLTLSPYYDTPNNSAYNVWFISATVAVIIILFLFIYPKKIWNVSK